MHRVEQGEVEREKFMEGKILWLALEGEQKFAMQMGWGEGHTK